MEQYSEINVIHSLLSIAGLWIIWVIGFRDFGVKYFQHRIFCLRAELFDFAQEGRISFTHPAYEMLRTTMNGLIRFSDRISLLDVVFFPLLAKPYLRKEGGSYRAELARHMAKLDDDAKEKMWKYHKKMNAYLVRHLLVGSPIVLVTVILPVVFFLTLKLCMDGVLELMKMPLEVFDLAARTEGKRMLTPDAIAMPCR